MFLLDPRKTFSYYAQDLAVSVEHEESPGVNGLVQVPMADHLHKKLITGQQFYNKPGLYWLLALTAPYP